MASTLQKEEILKAAQAMSKEDRLKLIAEIAALPDGTEPRDSSTIAHETGDFDQEVMKTARQFMDKYSDLLRRLAE